MKGLIFGTQVGGWVWAPPKVGPQGCMKLHRSDGNFRLVSGNKHQHLRNPSCFIFSPFSHHTPRKHPWLRFGWAELPRQSLHGALRFAGNAAGLDWEQLLAELGDPLLTEETRSRRLLGVLLILTSRVGGLLNFLGLDHFGGK